MPHDDKICDEITLTNDALKWKSVLSINRIIQALSIKLQLNTATISLKDVYDRDTGLEASAGRHWARRDDGDRRNMLGLAPSREPKNAIGSASGVRPVEGKSKNSWLAADVGTMAELTCRAVVVAIGKEVGREAWVDVGML